MDKLNYTSHELAARIGKMPKDFTKKDIIDFIIDNEIRHVNFQYPAGADHRGAHQRSAPPGLMAKICDFCKFPLDKRAER